VEKALITHLQACKGLDTDAKIKLILFASGVKPVTYVQLRIGKNLHDKHRFEQVLRDCGILFKVGRAKGYEEIKKVTGNKAVWAFNGTWYGYDLFHTKEQKKEFGKYVSLIKKRRHVQSDRVGGKLYGYPKCCITSFLELHTPGKLAKKYSYYQYFKKLHDLDRAFPFLMHTPCRVKCAQSVKLNKKYREAVKKAAPRFYKQYTKKRTYKTQIIVDTESKGAWKTHNGHEYVVVTRKPIEKKYDMISWLTKKTYERGTILDATITMQYDYATVKPGKKRGHLENFHHERHFRT